MPNASALAAGLAVGAASLSTAVWAVRSKSSSAFGPSVWHGAPGRRAIALTFDDGPSVSTPRFLDLLAEFNAPSTFFQVGANVLRHPDIARAVVAAGHEIGNHSHTHLNCALKSASLIEADFARAQQAIAGTTGVNPVYVRAPYGVRWFGFRQMQKNLGLTGVMWTVIGRDWRLPADAIAARVLTHASDGGIVCLHDGRDTRHDPDLTPALGALRRILPALRDAGYHFVTVSQLLCHKS